MKLEQLSPEQLNAINCRSSRACINASPGAAKTTVLGLVAIKHGIRLSASKPSDSPPSVLVTTLTNYAANKAKQSIRKLLNNQDLIQRIFNVDDTEDIIERIHCSTLHSLSFSLV